MMYLTPKLDWTEDDYYNPDDLNRVENNTIEVAELVKQMLGIDATLEPQVTDRDYTSIEFADSLNRIERNIDKLNCLNLESWKPNKTTWQAGDPFDYKDALRLENNLAILHDILSKNVNAVHYCGSFNCGGQVI